MARSSCTLAGSWQRRPPDDRDRVVAFYDSKGEPTGNLAGPDIAP